MSEQINPLTCDKRSLTIKLPHNTIVVMCSINAKPCNQQKGKECPNEQKSNR